MTGPPIGAYCPPIRTIITQSKKLTPIHHPKGYFTPDAVRRAGLIELID